MDIVETSSLQVDVLEVRARRKCRRLISINTTRPPEGPLLSFQSVHATHVHRRWAIGRNMVLSRATMRDTYVEEAAEVGIVRSLVEPHRLEAFSALVAKLRGRAKAKASQVNTL